jgi:hypothetical protein
VKRIQPYAFLFAIQPLVVTYFQIDKSFSLLSVFLVAVGSLAVTVALHFILRRVVDGDRASIAIGSMWIWFFSYSSFRSLVFAVHGPTREMVLILSWILLFVGCCWLVLKKTPVPQQVNRFFTIFAILLLVLGLIPSAKVVRADFKPSAVVSRTDSTAVRNPDVPRPDIYFVLVDSYPSSRALKEVLGIDNSTFIKSLQARGFSVATESHSNYPFTLLSLSSTLNMQYLPMSPAPNNQAGLACNVRSVENAVGDNLVIGYLRSRGYSFVDLSIWGNLERKSDYQYTSNYYVDRFLMELAHKTILSRPIIENVVVGLEERYDDYLKMRALEEVPALKGPKFVYVHLYATHEPYVIDEFGQKLPLTRRIFQSMSDKDLFQKQFWATTHQVERVVDAILRGSKTPPAIIVQGDHGPPVVGESRDLRTSILNAFFLPGVADVRLPQDCSPVNSFRFLFNTYFDARLDFLENKHYAPGQTPGLFEDVSALFRK